MSQEITGYVVGPTPVRDFLANYMPKMQHPFVFRPPIQKALYQVGNVYSRERYVYEMGAFSYAHLTLATKQ